MPPRLRWHLYRLLSVGVDKVAVLFQFILFGNRFAVAVFDEHHQYDCDDNADRAVQEQHFVFAVIHDKARDERGDCLRGHRCGVIVPGILSDGFRGGKLGNHRERVDVCNDKTEARDKIKQRKQYCGNNRFFAGVDKEENKEERNDRKSKAQHY